MPIQRTTPISKRRMWSVYIFVKMGPMSEEQYMRFMYTRVTKMYKKGKFLHVQEGMGKQKVIHIHDVKRIENIQIRKHKRGGVQ